MERRFLSARRQSANKFILGKLFFCGLYRHAEWHDDYFDQTPSDQTRDRQVVGPDFRFGPPCGFDNANTAGRVYSNYADLKIGNQLISLYSPRNRFW